MCIAISRRALLRQAAPGAAALLLSGCAVPRRAATGAYRSSALPNSSPRPPLHLGAYGIFGSVPHLYDRFNATHPGMVITAGRSPGAGLVLNGMFEDGIDQQVQQFEPIEGPLRATNFDPARLLSGSVAAFSPSGHIYGLPVSQAPRCLWWRTDAFAAAGLTAPDPLWSLADFESACATLQGLAAGGRLRNLEFALGPMLGRYTVVDKHGQVVAGFPGALESGGLWEAFALGFGGSVVDAGRFRLTGAQTLVGLARVVDIARPYSLPTAAAPIPAESMAAFSDRYAMEFTAYSPPGGSTPPDLPRHDSRWKYVRLPVFPATPIIPTAYWGEGVTAGSAAPYTDAAARFLLWLFEQEPQALLAAADIPPVLADPAVQGAFWTNAAPATQAVGDWRHFVDYPEGWPATPPNSIVAQALEQAVKDPPALADALAQADRQMNAWVDARAAGKSPPAG